MIVLGTGRIVDGQVTYVLSIHFVQVEAFKFAGAAEPIQKLSAGEKGCA